MHVNESSVDQFQSFSYAGITKNEGGRNVDSKVFGQFIAKIRKENHMTQAELARLIGVTDKAVSRWERGIGFPDINILEPLSNALGISLLELMRSEKFVMGNKNTGLSENEMTEMMTSAVEMARENQRQDKVSVWIGGIVTIIIAVVAKLSGRANIGGSLLVGSMAALAIVGLYLFAQNKEDTISRKIYGFFMLSGIGISIILLHLMDVSSFALVWGMYCIFGFVIGIINK